MYTLFGTRMLHRGGSKITAGLVAVVIALCNDLGYVVAAPSNTLYLDKGLSAENNDVLVSQNGLFALGFFSILPNDTSRNYLCVGYEMSRAKSLTVVWMATRDSFAQHDGRLHLDKNGDLILDASRYGNVLWSTHTGGKGAAKLVLMDNGNLVLYTRKGKPLWQSFSMPTDTLVPGQRLQIDSQLISWKNRSNPLEGPFSLNMQEDQNLVTYFHGDNGPAPQWASGTYVSGAALGNSYSELDSAGALTIRYFDNAGVPQAKSYRNSLDYGKTNVTRRLTLGFDGNLRILSWDRRTNRWLTAWQALNSAAPTPQTSPASSPAIESPPAPGPDGNPSTPLSPPMEGSPAPRPGAYPPAPAPGSPSSQLPKIDPAASAPPAPNRNVDNASTRATARNIDHVAATIAVLWGILLLLT